MASALANRMLDFPNGTFAGDLKRAEELATKAVAASPRSPLAHFAKGQILRAQNRPEEAMAEYEMVLALDQYSIDAMFGIGWCKFYTGAIEEMIAAPCRPARTTGCAAYTAVVDLTFCWRKMDSNHRSLAGTGRRCSTGKRRQCEVAHTSPRLEGLRMALRGAALGRI